MDLVVQGCTQNTKEPVSYRCWFTFDYISGKSDVDEINSEDYIKFSVFDNAGCICFLQRRRSDDEQRILGKLTWILSSNVIRHACTPNSA